MLVRLSWHEVSHAVAVGTRRHMEALRRNSEDGYGLDAVDAVYRGWDMHIEGACAELAVAKALNLYWEPRINTYRSVADIGDRIEVRRRSRGDYEMLIRPSDPDGRLMVHVTGAVPTFLVRGWFSIGEAKRHDEWKKAYGGRPDAWFVPNGALMPLDDLAGYGADRTYIGRQGAD